MQLAFVVIFCFISCAYSQTLQHEHISDRNNYCHIQKCPSDNSSCINIDGNCNCKQGFVGSNCTDRDECSRGHGDPCGHRGVCINNIGSYKCLCLPGWYGIHCDKTDNTATNGTCLPGYKGPRCNIALCDHGYGVNNSANFTCVCDKGWTHEHTNDVCSKDINECDDNRTCQNNATCTNIDGDYNCTCKGPWLDKNCSTFDHCINNTCNQNQICENKPGPTNAKHFTCQLKSATPLTTSSTTTTTTQTTKKASTTTNTLTTTTTEVSTTTNTSTTTNSSTTTETPTTTNTLTTTKTPTTTTPTTTPPQPTAENIKSDQNTQKSRNNVPAIVGGVVGSAVGVTIVGVCIYMYKWKGKRCRIADIPSNESDSRSVREMDDNNTRDLR